MDGWREGGRGGGEEEEEEGGGEGGLTIREKFRPVKVSFLPIVLLIKTAPAPELIEGLSLSLTLSPNPSSSPPPSPVLLTRQLVCEEERKREKKKKERKKEGPYQCSIMVLPSTSHHAAINIAPITVKGTRLGQDDNEHILSSPAEELKRTHKHTRKHTLGTTCTNVHKTCAA